MATPTGMMNAAHTPISQIVPQNAAWMPDWSALIDEKLVMKSQVRLPAPSATTSTSRTPSSSDRDADADEQPDKEAACPSCGSPRAALPIACALRDRLKLRAHSYTCLYLRTKRIEIMFMISVITNSVVPTAKSVL